MAFRAAGLLVVLAGLAGLAGCERDPYIWRQPCEPDAAGTCCPLHSHEVVLANPDLIICAADEVPCVDAGAGADATTDAQ